VELRVKSNGRWASTNMTNTCKYMQQSDKYYVNICSSQTNTCKLMQQKYTWIYTTVNLSLPVGFPNRGFLQARCLMTVWSHEYSAVWTMNNIRVHVNNELSARTENSTDTSYSGIQNTLLFLQARCPMRLRSHEYSIVRIMNNIHSNNEMAAADLQGWRIL